MEPDGVRGSAADHRSVGRVEIDGHNGGAFNTNLDVTARNVLRRARDRHQMRHVSRHPRRLWAPAHDDVFVERDLRAGRQYGTPTALLRKLLSRGKSGH